MNNHYCMVSIKDSDRPEILEIQGVTWFETQELAYQYYMFLKPELREEYVYPVEEQDLPSFENITPEDVKVAKYKTGEGNENDTQKSNYVFLHVCCYYRCCLAVVFVGLLCLFFPKFVLHVFSYLLCRYS